MGNKVPNKLLSMFRMKCPNCRKGNMFTNKSIFPLKEVLEMPTNCPVCDQKFEIEVGFWYGTGYVSYAMCVALIFIFAVLYALIIGFSWKDNSIYIFMPIVVGLLVLLQPFIMRLSRVFYLYVFVKFGEGQTIKSE